MAGILDLLAGLFGPNQAQAAPPVFGMTPDGPMGPAMPAALPAPVGGPEGSQPGMLDAILKAITPQMPQTNVPGAIFGALGKMGPQQIDLGALAGKVMPDPAAAGTDAGLARMIPGVAAAQTMAGIPSPSAAAPAPVPTAPVPFTWGASKPREQSFSIPGPGQAAPPADPIAAYMPKMFGAESGGKMVPNAAGASSAFGPAQFTNGTWLDTVKTADPETWKALGGDTAKVLALRTDPKYHNTMAEAFTRQNAQILGEKGLPVNDASLYTMHFFGKGDGPKVLTAADNTPIEQVVSGDSIAANPHLKGMTVGDAKAWAGRTIGAKGSPSTNAFGIPNPPNFTAPRLPGAPTVEPLKGVDPAAYDRFNAMRVFVPPPMSTADRMTNVLASMAQGAKGATTIGDLLLGAGAGVAQGAAGNIARNRGELEKGAERSQALEAMQAGVGVDKAKAVAQGANYQTEARNQTQQATFQVATQQAQLDAEIKNKIEAARAHIDEKAWQLGQPQFHYDDKDGTVTVITKTPQGGVDGKVVNLGSGSGIRRTVDTIEQARKGLGDKGASLVDPLKYQMAGEIAAKESGGNPEAVKEVLTLEVLRDVARSNGLSNILGAEEHKKLQKQAEAGFSGEERASRDYATKLNERMFDLAAGQRNKDRAKFDQLLLSQVLKTYGQTGPGAGASLILRGGIK